MHLTRRRRDPIPQQQRVVGVVAAYREDGEVDGMRSQALYRKPLTDTDPSKRENRPPGNLILRMRPGTTASVGGTAPEAPAGRGARVVVRRQADERGARVDDRVCRGAGGGHRPGRGVPDADGGLGLTGVLWQSVTQRTREIGLRRAKGAERTRVQRQILGELVVMTSMAVAVAAILVAQVPIVSPFYWVETHVYVVGLYHGCGDDLPADAAVRLVPEPARDTRRAGRGVAIRVGGQGLKAEG